MKAIRDLVRARLAAVRTLRQARQQLSGFLLRQGQHYQPPSLDADRTGVGWPASSSNNRCTTLYWRIVLQRSRQRRIGAIAWTAHIEAAALPDWSLAPVVERFAGTARRGFGSSRDPCRRTRRHHPLHQSAPVHGVSGPGAVRTFERRQHDAKAASPKPATAPHVGC